MNFSEQAQLIADTGEVGQDPLAVRNSCDKLREQSTSAHESQHVNYRHTWI